MRKDVIPLIHRGDTLERRNQVKYRLITPQKCTTNLNVKIYWPQILSVAGATMALFATGNILGFSSVSIPALLNKDSEIKADADDMSWMGKVIWELT